ncbi:MAG: LysE family transporter, partial [Syntrophomonadaceae bacterium]|nr:LysE family transporter [Syntrophomonadaceae bacterium]
MQIPALFVTAFIVGLSGAMMPGPLLTLTITESARRGFIAGPLIVLGHAILELILVLALLAGAAVYLSQPGVTRIISILGGGFLIYLGIITVRDILAGRVQLNNLEQP